MYEAPQIKLAYFKIRKWVFCIRLGGVYVCVFKVEIRKGFVLLLRGCRHIFEAVIGMIKISLVNVNDFKLIKTTKILNEGFHECD